MKDQEQFELFEAGTNNLENTLMITSGDPITIDLGNYSAACDTINIGSLTTTDTITLGSTMNYGTIGGSSGNYYISNGTSSQWSTSGGGIYTTTMSPTVNIDTDGINVKDSGDIKIGNKSLKDFISKMEDRLAILQPAPEKLEKFEALKKAYEHYKLMEKLCQEETKEEDK